MKLSLNQDINILEDKSFKIILSICIPLFIISIVQIPISILNNKIINNSGGERLFAILSSIGSITGFMTNFISAITNQAWIKSAKYYDKNGNGTKFFIQGIYAIWIFNILLAIIMICASNPILNFLRVQEDFYNQAKTYYVIYVLTYIFTSTSTFIIQISNGTGSSLNILITNILTPILSIINSFLLLSVLNTDVYGLSLYTNVTSLLIAIILFIKLVYFKVIDKFSFKYLKPDFTFIFSIIKDGLFIAFQHIFAYIGIFIAERARNTYLSANFLSVISISIPVTILFSALSSSTYLFFPKNYAFKKLKRVKSFLKTIILICFIYGLICTILYHTIARPYYSSLYEDKNLIDIGTKHWIFYSFGFIPLFIKTILGAFFESIGYKKIPMISGFTELIGLSFCGFILIPNIGNVGFSIASPMGWAFAMIFMSACYFIFRKKIYNPDKEKLQKLGEKNEN